MLLSLCVCVCVCVKSISTSHDADQLMECLKSIITQFNLDGKVIAITTDNASVNVKAMTLLRNEYKNICNFDNIFNVDANFHHIRCSAHSINLIEGLGAIRVYVHTTYLCNKSLF